MSGDETKNKRRIVTLPIPGKSAPVIPVPQDGEWLDLLFPAHVKNTDKALTYITTRLTDKTTDVAVKLRPRNPSCIPIRSKIQPALKLLIKVNKQTRAVRVVAVIRKEVKFGSLADFQLQYAPAPPTPSHCGIPSPLIDYNYLLRDRHSIRVNCSTHAIRDVPFDYFYHSLSPGETGSVRSGEMKVRQPRPSMVIHWRTTDTEVPTTPMKDTQLNMFKQNFLNEYRTRLEEMFRTRPIWSTAAFANIFKMREVPLRTQLLPHYSYYCNTGPWRGMWIKFGYDPRSDPINRKFQLIDFRAPRIIQAKSAVQRYSNTNKEEYKGANTGAETCHIYRSDKLPFKRQSHYQICDIQDSRCQAVLQNYETGVFTHSDGFYSKGALPAVRKVMTEQFHDILETRKEVEEPDGQVT